MVTIRGAAFASVFLLANASSTPLYGECVILTADSLKQITSDLIFAGTVAEKTPGEYGFRVKFEVDCVWKGSVPRRFDIYVSVLRGEMPTFEGFSVGQRHVVVARKLTDSRERAGLGLADTDAPVYGPVECTGFLSPTIERDLGVSKPPSGH
jgi:hypothetical protein